MAIAGVSEYPTCRPPADRLHEQAVLHELATRTLPLAFFATHYGSLTDDFAYHPNIRNMYMSTSLDDEQQKVSFRALTPLCNLNNLRTAHLPLQTR